MPTPNGPAIRQLRQERGITISQLAEMTGVSYQHVANCELGHNTARIEFLYRVANVLDVPIEKVVIPISGGASAETTHPEPTHPPNKKRGLQPTALAS